MATDLTYDTYNATLTIRARSQDEAQRVRDLIEDEIEHVLDEFDDHVNAWLDEAVR